ncbi:MAG: hypothetical protein U0269_07545 [Polyangiales bacterium]
MPSARSTLLALSALAMSACLLQRELDATEGSRRTSCGYNVVQTSDACPCPSRERCSALAPRGLRFFSLTAPCVRGVCALASSGRQTIEIVTDNGANLDNQRVVIERGSATASPIRNNRFDLQSTGGDDITLSVREAATGALLDTIRVPVLTPTSVGLTARMDVWGADFPRSVTNTAIVRGLRLRVYPQLTALRSDGTSAPVLDADLRVESTNALAARVEPVNAQTIPAFDIDAIAPAASAIAIVSGTTQHPANIDVIDSPDELELSREIDDGRPQPSPWSASGEPRWVLRARYRGKPVLGANSTMTDSQRSVDLFAFRVDWTAVPTPEIPEGQEHVHVVFRSGDAILRGRFTR